MMKTAMRRRLMAALAWILGWCAGAAQGQEVTYQTINGVRHQITKQVVQQQVPVTVMQNQQRTVYTQQLSANTINHRQLYCVPNTSYQWQTKLNGRWNPFVTPYWTYNLKPVTTWNTQVANVQIPVNRVAWVPQTQSIQVPVTAYRTQTVETTTTLAMNNVLPSTSQGLATARPLTNARTATLSPHTLTPQNITPTAIASLPTRPITPSNSNVPLGSTGEQTDRPPRNPTGKWKNPNLPTGGSRYPGSNLR